MKLRLATAASIIALSFASPVMAQSSSTVGQTGYDNAADVEQIGAEASNDSQITQNNDDASQVGNTANVFQTGTNGLDNLSVIDQDGALNTADITQGGNGVPDYNDSSVTQTGDGNSANVVQGDLVNSNQSTIVQDGSGNAATVFQGGNPADPNDPSNGFVDDPTTDIVEGPQGVNTGDNVSTIDQIGNGNTASVSQGGGAGAVNTSDIDQGDPTDSTNNNTAIVAQGGSSANDSKISQNGGSSLADVKQGGTDAENTSLITQTDLVAPGGANSADVTQTGSSDNDSIISQDGDLNVADVTQSGGLGAIYSSTINQAGAGNLATVVQH